MCMLSCFSHEPQGFCNSSDCSPPGSSVHGILQARILEWVAMTCSRGFSRPRDQTQVSCIAGGFFIAKPPEKPLTNSRAATISNIHFILHYSPHNFHSLFPLRILFRVLVLQSSGHLRETIIVKYSKFMLNIFSYFFYLQATKTLSNQFMWKKKEIRISRKFKN